MKTSDAGRKFIQQNEGLRLTAYQDQGGVWTIGIGHTMGVKEGDTITEEQADMLLESDLLHVEIALNKLIPSDCTQNQFDALADFAFNLGTGALATMLDHGWQDVPNQMPKWCNVAKKPNAGLLARRKREVALFLTPAAE